MDNDKIKFSRKWAMPSGSTFLIKPIGEFVAEYLSKSVRSIDPFARDFAGADITNDLNPDTLAEYHQSAEGFLASFVGGEPFDLIIFDPPYSPRQISECYENIGRTVTTEDTQNAALYKRCRSLIDKIIAPGGKVLSFGWNSAGMGKERGYEILEIMLVNHGGAHNDTICMAEKKLLGLFENG